VAAERAARGSAEHARECASSVHVGACGCSDFRCGVRRKSVFRNSDADARACSHLRAPKGWRWAAGKNHAFCRRQRSRCPQKRRRRLLL